MQIGGTSMCNPFAPSEANLFLGKLEEKIYRSTDNKPINPLRYIDDGFFYWTTGLDNLNKFMDFMNEQHDTIKFTFEYSQIEIPFLDTLVRIHPTTRKMYTTLYSKTTDTHSYVFFTSAHNKSTLTKSPYGQFLRLRRICTMDYDFDTESANMIRHYLRRGYPKALLTKHRERARLFTQDDLLTPHPKNSTEREIMVTRFNPNNPDIMKVIKRHWNIIQFSDDCNNNFTHNPMLGLRKQPNVSNLLCRAIVQYPPKNNKQTNKYYPKYCHRLALCKYCPKINKGPLKITSTGRNFFSKFKPGINTISCELKNIIYCITCSKCKLQYIGETSRPIRQRIYEHLYSIKKYNT
jgi:hypothetical protein